MNDANWVVRVWSASPLPDRWFNAVSRWTLTFGLMLFPFQLAWSAAVEGEVVGVTDGDTLVLLDRSDTQYIVRIAGIDAPEKRQDFGTRAHQSLARTTFRRMVIVDWHKRDRYGRLVGKVLLDGKDVGLGLVVAGLAWHYKAYEQEQTLEDRQSYAIAESRARAERAGLWLNPSPLPPWEFRRRR